MQKIKNNCMHGGKTIEEKENETEKNTNKENKRKQEHINGKDTMKRKKEKNTERNEKGN